MAVLDGVQQLAEVAPRHILLEPGWAISQMTATEGTHGGGGGVKSQSSFSFTLSKQACCGYRVQQTSIYYAPSSFLDELQRFCAKLVKTRGGTHTYARTQIVSTTRTALGACVFPAGCRVETAEYNGVLERHGSKLSQMRAHEGGLIPPAPEWRAVRSWKQISQRHASSCLAT